VAGGDPTGGGGGNGSGLLGAVVAEVELVGQGVQAPLLFLRLKARADGGGVARMRTDQRL